MELLRRNTLEQEEYDEERTKALEVEGHKVIRFWNSEVMNDINEVLKAIQFKLMENPRE